MFNYYKQAETENLIYHQLNKEENILTQIVSVLYAMQIQSLMIEGGAKLLQSFIDEGLWDEARIICNEQLVAGNGLSAPVLKNHLPVTVQKIKTDIISFFNNKRNKQH